MIRYTNDVPPRVDRTQPWHGHAPRTPMFELYDEIDRLQRELAEVRAKPCPYVTGGETKHCTLAEKDARDAARLEYLLSMFYFTDGAWIGSVCFHVHAGGLRAAIDEAMKEST